MDKYDWQGQIPQAKEHLQLTLRRDVKPNVTVSKQGTRAPTIANFSLLLRAQQCLVLRVPKDGPLCEDTFPRTLPTMATQWLLLVAFQFSLSASQTVTTA